MNSPDNKRILYLLEHFQPEPARLRGLPFVQAMGERGLTFEVLTGFPFFPGDTVYAGYRQHLYQREEIGGVTIHRSPLVMAGSSGSVARRVLSYLSLAASSTLNASTRVRRPDAVMCTLGPGPFATVAQLLAARFRCPLILDVQDLWPDSLIASGMWPSRLTTKPVDWALSKSYKRAARTICLSDGSRDLVTRRGGDPARSVTLLNPALDVEITDDDRAVSTQLLTSLPDRFFCYTGNLGPLQGLDIIIKALRQMQDPDCGLVIAGTGRDQEALKALAGDDSRISFVGWQTAGVAQLLVRASLAAVMHLHSTALDESAIPSKLGTYLGEGVPVIVAAKGEAARLAKRCDAGPVIEPGDVDDMARALTRLQQADPTTLAKWGDNAARFASHHLSERSSWDAIAEVIRSAVDDQSNASASMTSIAP